ncbi:MAG: hypothetical protein JNJ53_14020 [Rhizobiales bacterium]|nr:hypothetical protein [Hyphomicrobiales bacterium]
MARGFIYHGDKPQYAAAGRAIVETVAPISQAILLFLGTPFGDGWDRLDGGYPAWQGFYAWRASLGEQSRLYEIPGHKCDEHQGEELATLIAFALQLGWDGLLAARPGRDVLGLSHDDRIEFHAGFKHRALAVELEKLGFYQSA